MTPAQAAERLAAQPADTALCCDFDGTLAPIVDEPTAATLPDTARAALARLTARLGVVAIVSGRPASFLVARAAIPGVSLYGLYGLEKALADGSVQAHPQVAAWQPAVERAKVWLASELDGQPGIYLEDKGRSVAVHWRHAPDHEEAALLVGVAAGAVAESTGLHAEAGKLVAELRPPVAVDKGDALAQAAQGCAVVAYAGDDRGDLPALAAARSGGGLALGVEHIGETPEELRAACDVLFDGVAALGAWLRDLADRVEDGGG